MQLYSGHVLELGKLREHLAKTGLPRAPDAEVLIAAASDASGAARIDLYGGVNGRHLGSQISVSGDAKLVHGCPEPIGWSVQAVVVELGEIKVDLRGHRVWWRRWQLYRDLRECRLAVRCDDSEQGHREHLREAGPCSETHVHEIHW